MESTIGFRPTGAGGAAESFFVSGSVRTLHVTKLFDVCNCPK